MKALYIKEYSWPLTEAIGGEDISVRQRINILLFLTITLAIIGQGNSWAMISYDQLPIGQLWYYLQIMLFVHLDKLNLVIVVEVLRTSRMRL